MPAELTLTSFTFARGNKLTLRGNAPSDQREKIIEYNSELSKATQNGALLFSKVEPPQIDARPGAATASWYFDCTVQLPEIE